MAFIDYGAILKINGVQVNNEMFMNSDGIIEKAYYPKYDCYVDIKDNFFVYAGDNDLLLVFYKTWFCVIQNDIVVNSFSPKFASETLYVNDYRIKVERIDKDYQIEPFRKWANSWEDFVKENWRGATGKEKLSDLENGHKWRKRYCKHLKRIARNKNIAYKYPTNKYIATWEYKGDKYECVFGYGISADKDVYDEIKYNYYDYTNKEREVLDKFYD